MGILTHRKFVSACVWFKTYSFMEIPITTIFLTFGHFLNLNTFFNYILVFTITFKMSANIIILIWTLFKCFVLKYLGNISNIFYLSLTRIFGFIQFFKVLGSLILGSFWIIPTIIIFQTLFSI